MPPFKTGGPLVCAASPISGMSAPALVMRWQETLHTLKFELNLRLSVPSRLNWLLCAFLVKCSVGYSGPPSTSTGHGSSGAAPTQNCCDNMKWGMAYSGHFKFALVPFHFGFQPHDKNKEVQEGSRMYFGMCK